MALLAYKHHGIYNDIKTSKIKSFHNRKKIQNGLDFVDTVSIVQQRNRNFFLSQWFIINVTIKELFLKYIKSNPEVPVSLGTFLALKPFYVRSATTKDIKICCCKKHSHARWSIQALIQCATKQQVDLNSIDSLHSLIILQVHVRQNQQLALAGNVHQMPTKHVST